MSDVPEAPDPLAPDEVALDPAAFLPEGTVLAVSGTEPVDDDDDPRPSVDLAALERIEADLAAVDAALEAIDAGEPGRSALLVELLGEEPTAR